MEARQGVVILSQAPVMTGKNERVHALLNGSPFLPTVWPFMLCPIVTPWTYLMSPCKALLKPSGKPRQAPKGHKQ